jgi:uncharacterized protein (DUF3820 family)
MIHEAEQFVLIDDYTHFIVNEKPLCGGTTAHVGIYNNWDMVTCPDCRALRDRDISQPLPQQPPPETTKESLKREPCYQDGDRMKFGKHKDERLADVPASYLHWLWTQRPISDKRLENYIFNNITALKQEHPDGLWT